MPVNEARKYRMAEVLAYYGDPEDSANLGLSRVGFSPNQKTTNELFTISYRILLGDTARTKRAEDMFNALGHWLTRAGIPLPKRSLPRKQVVDEAVTDDD